MKRSTRIILALVGAGVSTGLVVASVPRALVPAQGGLWDVSRQATGHNPQRICVPTVDALAQYEHRGKQCTRMVIADRGAEAVIHYTCTDGGFGRSDVTLITPRAVRIDTQGISNGLPFHYQLHARRVGNCPR